MRQPRLRDQKSELYGRTLAVIAAEQYASRLVVSQSQRAHPTRWESHKEIAEKALRKLAGAYLPASLKQLERAIARAHREYDTAATQHTQQATAARTHAQTEPQNDGDDVDDDDEPVDQNDDIDVVEDELEPGDHD